LTSVSAIVRRWIPRISRRSSATSRTAALVAPRWPRAGALDLGEVRFKAAVVRVEIHEQRVEMLLVADEERVPGCRQRVGAIGGPGGRRQHLLGLSGRLLTDCNDGGDLPDQLVHLSRS